MKIGKEQPSPIRPRGDAAPREPGPAAIGYCLGWSRGEARRFLFAIRVLQTPDAEQVVAIAEEAGVPFSTARGWHRDFLDQLHRDARASLQLHGLTQADWVKKSLEEDLERPLGADR